MKHVQKLIIRLEHKYLKKPILDLKKQRLRQH